MGIYTVSGKDYVGKYTGRAELRRVDDQLKLIKLTDYTQAQYQSFSISSAFEGIFCVFLFF